MNNVLLIARRELGAYLRTMSGYVIIAVLLFLDGLAFNAFAVAGTARKSSEVLADFFFWTSGVGMAGAVFLSMRLIAEERQTGTVQLLYSSPVHDREIVLGKFLASLAFLCLFYAGTAYMPILVAVYGKISLNGFPDVTQGIFSPSFFEFVQYNQIGQIQHVNFFKLTGCPVFRRHHVNRYIHQIGDGTI